MTEFINLGDVSAPNRLNWEAEKPKLPEYLIDSVSTSLLVALTDGAPILAASYDTKSQPNNEVVIMFVTDTAFGLIEYSTPRRAPSHEVAVKTAWAMHKSQIRGLKVDLIRVASDFNEVRVHAQASFKLILQSGEELPIPGRGDAASKLLDLLRAASQ